MYKTKTLEVRTCVRVRADRMPWRVGLSRLRAVDTDELEKQQVEAAAKPLTEAEKLQLKVRRQS